jgi:hypothetical protein
MTNVDNVRGAIGANSGCTAAELAAITGMTENQTKNAIQYLLDMDHIHVFEKDGKRYKIGGQVLREKVIAMARDGKSVKEISDATGYRHNPVRTIVSKARKRGDLPTLDPFLAHQRHRVIVRLAWLGMPIGDIADLVEIRADRVVKILAKARAKGQLVPDKTGNTVKPMARSWHIATFWARRANFPIGSVPDMFSTSVESDVLRKGMVKAKNEGYGSFAEYLADLVADDVLGGEK